MGRLSSNIAMSGFNRILQLTFATFWFISLQADGQTYDTNDIGVQTFAGSGFYGYYDGIGQQTMFNSPSAIVGDSISNLFVLDFGNARIRRVGPDASVTTFAGNGGTWPAPPGCGTNV